MPPRGQGFLVKTCQHSIYTRGTSIPPQGEPGRSSLNRFNFLDRTNCIWVPHSRAILQNWTYIGLVCQSFYPGITYLNISPDKTKRTVGSAANVVYVFVPTKVTCNVDPEVLIVRGPTIPQPQPWGGGNCRLHFLTAYSMSLSKLRELQSGFAAFPQKKTIYVTKNTQVFMSKT